MRATEASKEGRVIKSGCAMPRLGRTPMVETPDPAMLVDLASRRLWQQGALWRSSTQAPLVQEKLAAWITAQRQCARALCNTHVPVMQGVLPTFENGILILQRLPNRGEQRKADDHETNVMRSWSGHIGALTRHLDALGVNSYTDIWNACVVPYRYGEQGGKGSWAVPPDAAAAFFPLLNFLIVQILKPAVLVVLDKEVFKAATQGFHPRQYAANGAMRVLDYQTQSCSLRFGGASHVCTIMYIPLGGIFVKKGEPIPATLNRALESMRSVMHTVRLSINSSTNEGETDEAEPISDGGKGATRNAFAMMQNGSKRAREEEQLRQVGGKLLKVDDGTDLNALPPAINIEFLGGRLRMCSPPTPAQLRYMVQKGGVVALLDVREERTRPVVGLSQVEMHRVAPIMQGKNAQDFETYGDAMIVPEDMRRALMPFVRTLLETSSSRRVVVVGAVPKLLAVVWAGIALRLFPHWGAEEAVDFAARSMPELEADPRTKVMAREAIEGLVMDHERDVFRGALPEMRDPWPFVVWGSPANSESACPLWRARSAWHASAICEFARAQMKSVQMAVVPAAHDPDAGLWELRHAVTLSRRNIGIWPTEEEAHEAIRRLPEVRRKDVAPFKIKTLWYWRFCSWTLQERHEREAQRAEELQELARLAAERKEEEVEAARKKKAEQEQNKQKPKRKK